MVYYKLFTEADQNNDKERATDQSSRQACSFRVGKTSIGRRRSSRKAETTRSFDEKIVFTEKLWMIEKGKWLFITVLPRH